MNNLINLGVVEQSGKIVVSSRDVARVFEKQHAHIIRDVRDLKISEEFSLSNFGESNYTDTRGKLQPEYLMTRDGFTILAMGYTGEKAMQFKEAYINAFNEMERKLQQPYSKEFLLENPEIFLEVLTQQIALKKQNEQLMLTAAKYEGHTNTNGLYKIGEIAKELGVGARTLNKFLRDCRVQYLPNGSKTWRLYSEYEKSDFAVPRIVKLDGNREIVLLVWTPKGRDFIFDLLDREMPDWYVA